VHLAAIIAECTDHRCLRRYVGRLAPAPFATLQHRFPSCERLLAGIELRFPYTHDDLSLLDVPSPLGD
jgi:hypothetical protein